MMKTFTTSDIQRICGVKIDLQKDWRARGYVKASVKEAHGHGTMNLFDIHDLFKIELFKRLSGLTDRGMASIVVKGITKNEWEAVAIKRIIRGFDVTINILDVKKCIRLRTMESCP